MSLVVRKRSGDVEPFDHAKLAAGIARAASGRLEPDTVDTVAAELAEALGMRGAEVTSEEVGVAVLERLRELDPIAYLRFSSVYKGFEDLADFEREVGELQRDLARRDLGGSLQKTTEPKGPTKLTLQQRPQKLIAQKPSDLHRREGDSVDTGVIPVL